MPRRIDSGREEEILSRYKNGESAASIARSLGVTGAGIGYFLRKRGVRTRNRAEANRLVHVHPIRRQGRLSRDKAWLLGVICGDGNIVSEEARRHGANKHLSRLHVSLGPDHDLAQEVARVISAVYEIRGRVDWTPAKGSHKRNWFYEASSIRMVNDLLKQGRFGTDDWEIPRPVLRAGRGVQGAFLQGLFDAESYVSSGAQKNPNRVVDLRVTNPAGYAQTQRLLSDLGIGFRTYSQTPRRGKKETLILQVGRLGDLCAFQKAVGFRCARKRSRLARACTPEGSRPNPPLRT